MLTCERCHKPLEMISSVLDTVEGCYSESGVYRCLNMRCSAVNNGVIVNTINGKLKGWNAPEKRVWWRRWIPAWV